MFYFCYRRLLFICCIMVMLQSKSSSTIWESTINLCNKGFQYNPFDEQILLLVEINVRSTSTCAQECQRMTSCIIVSSL
jgi:hypothetical protein